MDYWILLNHNHLLSDMIQEVRKSLSLTLRWTSLSDGPPEWGNGNIPLEKRILSSMLSPTTVSPVFFWRSKIPKRTSFTQFPRHCSGQACFKLPMFPIFPNTFLTIHKFPSVFPWFSYVFSSCSTFFSTFSPPPRIWAALPLRPRPRRALIGRCLRGVDTAWWYTYPVCWWLLYGYYMVNDG